MSPRDFWECLRATWLDMTEMALKKLVAAGFQSALNSKPVNKFFNSKLAQKLNDYLPGKARGYFIKPGVEGKKFFEKGGNVDLSILRNEKVWKATHKPSGKEMFVLLKDDDLDKISFAGYREVVQRLLEDFFGQGSAWLKENANETVQNDVSWRGLMIPIKPSWLGLDDDYEELMVQLDLVKFFSSETGINSEAFKSLFEQIFGPIGQYVHRVQSSPDPGREILNLDGDD